MSMRKFWGLVQWTVGGLAPLLLIGSASAAIIGGTINTTTPNSVGAVFSLLGPQASVGGVGIPVAGKDVNGMNELTGVTLAAPVAIDGGSLPLGMKVDSHIVWTNFTATSGIVAKVNFAGTIVGIITRSNTVNFLTPTNPIFGLLGTTYLNANNWGMENGASFAGLSEGVVISGSNEITFTSTGTGPDYVRVLTVPVPEPGSIAVLGLGAVGLVFAGYRRRRNQTTV